MELPSNRVKEIVTYFHAELDKMYGKNEVKVFISIIFENVLNINDLNLIYDVFILESELDRINKILQRLKKNEPIQYIFGEAQFYGLKLKVNANVLIPRPETEELVDIIIKSIQIPSCKILDIGTGSGCIAIALKKNIPAAIVTGVDVSKEALSVARDNAKQNNVQIDFKELDILSGVILPPVDIIVSNPPYITNTEKLNMHLNVLDNEPHLALFVTNNDPLQFYKAITGKALKSLSKGGMLFYELNEAYGNEVLSLVKESGFTEAVLIKDMIGKNRILKAVL